MAFSTKYKCSWFSVQGDSYEILIQKDGYSGNIITRGVNSPTLSIPDGDTIRATSLSFNMLSELDGELMELYTTEQKKWKVLLKRGSNIIWTGWIVPELYSEEYVADPYDVTITASDGIGYLKGVDYVVSEDKETIMNILKDCIGSTEIELNLIISNTAKYTGYVGMTPWFCEQKISKATFDGLTKYEVIERILTSLNATITQRNNCWIIERNSDLSSRVKMPWSLTSAVAYTANQKAIGTMSAGNYPIGSLGMEVVPAKKQLKIEYPTVQRPSYLANPYCDTDYGWSHSALVVAPWTTTIHDTKLNCPYYLIPPTGVNSQRYGIWQTIQVEQDLYSKFTLEFSYYAALISMFTPPSTGVKGEIWLTVKNGDAYLSNDGWTTEESHLAIAVQTSVGAALQDKGQYTKTSIEFSKLPNDGDLYVKLEGCDLSVTILIGSFYLYNSSYPLGIEKTATMVQNASTDAPDVSLSFNNALPLTVITDEEEEFELANHQLISYNHLVFGNGDINTNTWEWNGDTFDSYFDMMAEDCAQWVAAAKRKLSGTICGKGFLLADVVYDSASQKTYQIRKLDADLLNDECNVELLEILNNSESITMSDSVFSGTDDSTSSSGGSRGSSSSGGGSSISSHNQLTGRNEADSHPITAITGLSDFKDLFDSMFEKVTSGNDWYIKAKKDFCSIGAITAYGEGQGGGGGGVSNLYQLSDVPDYRTSYRGKILKSKSDGSGVEWVDMPTSAVWGNITGTLSAQTDLVNALAGKAALSHTHTKSQITDFAHTHSISDVTGLQTALDGKQAVGNYAVRASANNLIHSGNEFTFVPSGQSGSVHFNYRTVGGFDGAIDNYYFDDGAGHILYSLSTISSNAANGNTAYGWGNHASQGYLTAITKTMVENVLTGNISSHTHSYLPLSGGILTGRLTVNGNESNEIKDVINLNSTITNISSNLASIRHALSFKWYDTDWQIGSIRGRGTDSIGFGITKDNSVCVFRVDESNGYINENAIYHQGNLTTSVIASLGTLSNSITGTATKSNQLNSTLPSSVVVHSLSFYSGQPTIGTSSGNAYLGSSNNFNLLSFPDGVYHSSTVANIQNIRICWDKTSHWSDIITCPNNANFWVRNVTGGVAGNWYQLYHSGNLTNLSQLTDNLGSSPVHTHSQYLTSALAATTYHPKGGSTALPFDAKSLSLAGEISGATTIDASGMITARGYQLTYNSLASTIKQVIDVSKPKLMIQAGATAMTYGNTVICPNGGNLGVGTLSPEEKLDVNGAIVLRNGEYSVKIELDSNGNLKINGNVFATGAVTAYQSN